jgi:hypothetical protein
MKYFDDDRDRDRDREVCKDQEVVRCPIWLMDGMQRAIADVDPRDHQPHFVTDTTDARRIARDARDQYVRRLTSAWQTPSRDAAAPDASEELLRKHLRSEPDDNAQARREAAYRDSVQRIQNAWRTR